MYIIQEIRDMRRATLDRQAMEKLAKEDIEEENELQTNIVRDLVEKISKSSRSSTARIPSKRVLGMDSANV